MKNDTDLFDISAEFLLNYLYPDRTDSWQVDCAGTFYRNYSPDLLSVDEEGSTVRLARDSFLRLLPQGVIAPDNALKGKDFKQKYERLKKKEELLRELFKPVDTLAFRFGGEYRATKFLTARMGMYVDESPVSSDYLNPETPSMTKVAYTAGLSLRPSRFMSVDLAYCYVSSADPERTGSYPYVNSVLGIVNEKLQAAGVPASQLTSAVTDFSGNYTARAHTFSIGLNFHF